MDPTFIGAAKRRNDMSFQQRGARLRVLAVILASAASACRRSKARTDSRPDQRCRRHLAVSDLLDLVCRVRQGQTGRADQLSGDRVLGRHRPADRAAGLLRRDRHADDRRRVPGGAGANSPFPTVLAAVVPVYNVPGLKGELKFDAQLLADIFLGKVRNWNDPAIAELNGGISAPADGHQRRLSVRQLRHVLHLRGLPLQDRS